MDRNHDLLPYCFLWTLYERGETVPITVCMSSSENEEDFGKSRRGWD